MLAQASTRGLPLIVCAGWGVLALYTLALPLPTDVRPVGTFPNESRANGSVAASPVKAAKSNAAPAAKGAPVAAAAEEMPAEVAGTATSGSPLVDFLRRAVNTPPAAEPQEPIRP